MTGFHQIARGTPVADEIEVVGSRVIYDSRICAADLGRRAKALREQLAFSVEELSRLTGHDGTEILQFEQTGQGSVDLLLSLANALSTGAEVEQMLTVPKFNSLDEVEAYELRRTAAQ